MKVLFDENLSPKFCDLLADVYLGSESALDVGLDAEEGSQGPAPRHGDVEMWVGKRMIGLLIYGR
ncbi:MAG: hypothetical protein WAO58_04160 [Fimbriimonadaceae bacterium]